MTEPASATKETTETTPAQPAVDGQSAHDGVSSAAINGEDVQKSVPLGVVNGDSVRDGVPFRAVKGDTAYDAASSAHVDTPSVWASVSRWLPSGNADCDSWWQLTGPYLATLVHEAGYSTAEQYEAMIFHYHNVVPRLGPWPPSSRTPRWKSNMTYEGNPIEYSWKWNDAGGVPVVRYSMEAISPFAGTVLDPLNQASTKELLYQLQHAMSNLDLTWFHHFATVIYDTDREKYLAESTSHHPTTMILAFELLRKDIMVKATFIPRKLGQKGWFGLDAWESAIRSLAPENTILDQVMHFLKTDPEGSLLIPTSFCIDCIKSSKSRMKLYFFAPHTSFDSVRTILTMGGKLQGLDEALEELYILIRALVGLDKDFPSSEEIPPNSMDLPIPPGYLYYIDVQPGDSLPDIKWSIPIRRYGKDDLQVAEALTQWMESHGRGEFTKNYMRVIKSLATHGQLTGGVNTHRYIAAAFMKGSISVTSYIGGPEGYYK